MSVEDYDDLQYNTSESAAQKLTSWIEKQIEGRIKMFKKHWLNPKKWLRRLGLSPLGIGIISFALGAISVILNRDVDVIDQTVNSIISDIPILKKISEPEEANSLNIQASRTNTRRGRSRRRRGEEPSGGKALKTLAVFGLVIISIVGLYSSTALGDYVDHYGGETIQTYSSSTSQITEPVRYQASLRAQQLSCAAEGPQCIREWQLNETERPGTESVGQRYGLEIMDFDIGAEDSFDVAFAEEDQVLPVSYTINNPRQGFRGIEALNTSYRVSISDGDGLQCDTGWIPIEGFEVREGDGKYYGNDLIAGTSASQGFVQLDENHRHIEDPENALTLENCDMLQPGAGDTKNAVLDVRYDYFSQSTLNFEAMSEQARVSERIDTVQRDSVTADTPVQAALTVSSPATFDEQGRSVQPVSIGATLNTDDLSTSYQVEDLEISPPSRTCIAGEERGECAEFPTDTDDIDDSEMGDAQSCSFKPVSTDSQGDYNRLELTDTETGRLMSDNEAEGGLEPDHWFDRSVRPGIFGCVFNLEPDQNINPSGETMTMHIQANYTTRVEEDIGNFRVINSLCTDLNCPLIMPMDGENLENTLQTGEGSNTPEVDRATCDGVDAADGCDISENDAIDTRVMDQPQLERGQIAVEMTEDAINSNSMLFTPYVNNNPSEALQNLEQDILAVDTDDLYQAGRTDQGINITSTGISLEQIEVEEESEGGNIWGSWSF